MSGSIVAFQHSKMCSLPQRLYEQLRTAWILKLKSILGNVMVVESDGIT